MLAAYNVGQETMGLKEITKREFGVNQTPFDEVVDLSKQQVKDVDLLDIYPYACADALWCLRLGLRFDEQMDESQHNYFTLQQDLIPWIVETELRGVKPQLERLSSIDTAITELINKLEASIYEMAGRKFNINSLKQKADVLFGPTDEGGMGLLPPAKKNRRGVYETITTKGGNLISTTKESMRIITTQHPIIPAIVEHKSLMTIKSTFIDGMPKYINPYTGRVHPSVNQHRTATSRLSYTPPHQTHPVSYTHLTLPTIYSV